LNNTHVHIVTHDVPWPVNFGGVVDLFYKIKTLHDLGISIHLHCFTKNRSEQNILERYCETVNYYPRKNKFSFLHFTIPFIVQSRRSRLLIENLQKDNYPIILEGIHCTYPLFCGTLKNRKVKIRLHNIEHTYYAELAKNERNFFRKSYFKFESYLLKQYEKKLALIGDYWSVSHSDVDEFNLKYKSNNIQFLPVFIPRNKTSKVSGLGSYCLYHGNLSVNENEQAVEWLLTHVFNELKIPFVIAGMNPSERLKKMVYQYKHTCLVENPSEHEMNDLIKKAQINILPSFNHTGIKLKLLNAVFNGRHCLVNQAGFMGSGIETLCEVAETAEDFTLKIKQLFYQEFTESMLQKRTKILLDTYDNQKNAQTITLWIS
jgi:glycosyltransferase involved in cell wall biosynthesis